MNIGKNVMAKYLCDDCEEYYESTKDPRVGDIYNNIVHCICETCNDERVYKLYD